ncbi:SapC family protein [Pollutimonas bauzanensis]|uniref:SapC protein n=1 Tax=Pollutimonas bauzanensis TaxID=658167 RepID=A0A1M5VZ82_9BURK|nr:SapC family protein [Pollutimonas bauzanensis]SHH80582.1 SapC protein [Pollutimonas bauzanensis]
MTSTTLPLFYIQPRPLQAALHDKLSLAEQAGYGFAGATNAVPLVAGEIAVACRHYPIVFTEGALPSPVAVLGLRGQENLFVDADGQWRAGHYVPAYIRRYPFIFMENTDRGEYTLCIDEAAASVVEGRDHPLFNDDGSPSALSRSALDFCRDYQNQHAHTMEFMRALAEADVLVENRADITLPDGQRLSLSGFKIIDEAKFNKLPEDEFLRWRANGWLPLVYFHFVSIGTWSTLLDRIQPSAAGTEPGKAADSQ